MEFRFTTTFWRLLDAYKQHPRYIDSEGGARSGKTYSMLQLLYLLALKDKAGVVTSIVSETLPHLKKGAIRDFETLLGHTLKGDPCWNATETTYTLPNGAIIEFFSCDNAGKVHGPARCKLFINEAQNISWQIANQLFIRTSGMIFYDYNPTHSFWAHERIQPRDNCIRIHSTYKDNDFLSKEQVAEIEANREDKNWWRVYGLGLVGQLEGVIFDFDQVDEMPECPINVWGLDFGFTNDPTACVHIGINTAKKEIWMDELCYQKRMMNADICEMLTRKGVRKHKDIIFGDCAEPKTIEEIAQSGFNIFPCYKATRKAEQLQKIQGYRLHITKQSTNLIREIRGYVWDKDKDGRMLNEPIPYDDHLMDAMRYGIFTYLTTYAQRGKYRVR